jgi:hypothetical protein
MDAQVPRWQDAIERPFAVNDFLSLLRQTLTTAAQNQRLANRPDICR